jgi:hypothetical protein
METRADRRRSNRIMNVLKQAKSLALTYRQLTGKPLGITGEVAEYEAARILKGLTLAPARTPGYDAIEELDGMSRKLQIKGRCLLPGCKPGQRIGKIDIAKDFDAVLLVVLNEALEATAIYEADRDAVVAALTAPGSKSRNDRGALGLGKFRSIATLRWQKVNAGAK